MTETEDCADDFSLTPPTADRVAARALVLAAVCCRALIEKDAHDPGAEQLRQNVREWLDRIGVAGELEESEASLISTPLGQLAERDAIQAGWLSEGMVVLAWALGYASLPPVHEPCEPSDIANAMGFLDDRENTPLARPRLRSTSEIEQKANTYLTLHWRLVEQDDHPGRMDFVSYVAKCDWAALRIDELEILDGDLAIKGVPIDQVDYAEFRQALSIAQERQRAFDWLLGFDPLYSQVAADT